MHFFWTWPEDGLGLNLLWSSGGCSLDCPSAFTLLPGTVELSPAARPCPGGLWVEPCCLWSLGRTRPLCWCCLVLSVSNGTRCLCKSNWLRICDEVVFQIISHWGRYSHDECLMSLKMALSIWEIYVIARCNSWPIRVPYPFVMDAGGRTVHFESLQVAPSS